MNETQRGESGGPAPSAGLFNRAAERRADRLQAGSERPLALPSLLKSERTRDAAGERDGLPAVRVQLRAALRRAGSDRVDAGQLVSPASASDRNPETVPASFFGTGRVISKNGKIKLNQLN